MAYNSHNLTVLAYANGFTLWHYRTTDDISDVLQPGYFAAAADMLRLGDGMLVNARNGNAMVFVTDAAVGGVAPGHDDREATGHAESAWADFVDDKSSAGGLR